MSSLRALAQKAKYRLRAISQDNIRPVYETVQFENTYEEACLSARVQYAIIASQKKIEDDPLYNKVKRILSKDLDTMNVLSQIIEHDVYDTLNDTQKEKYMCKLSKRFRAMKEQIVKELSEENLSLCESNN